MLSALGGLMLKAILPTVTTAVVALAGRLIVAQLKKVGLEVDAKQEARLKELVETAVVAVEEYTRRAIKSQAENGYPVVIPTGMDKREMAAKIVLEQLPNVPPEKLQVTIDAMVPKVRQILPTVKVPPTPSTPATLGRR